MPQMNVLTKYQLLSSVALNVSTTSAATNIAYMNSVGIQAHYTGNGTGELFVEVSIDHRENPEAQVTGNWAVISSAVITAGAPADVYFDLLLVSAPWVRVRYADGSSGAASGTLDVFIAGKQA